MMRISMLFFCCVGISSVIGQTRNVWFHVENLPVREGFIYELPDRTHVHGDGFYKDESVSIQSCDDSCFAFFDGELTAMFNLDDYSACIIRTGRNFVIYSQLSKIPFAKKARNIPIKRGDFIGLIARNADDEFELEFYIQGSNHNYFTPEKIIRLLK